MARDTRKERGSTQICGGLTALPWQPSNPAAGAASLPARTGTLPFSHRPESLRLFPLPGKEREHPLRHRLGHGASARPATARLKTGECVIGAAGFPDGCRAINGKDGSVRWTCALPDAPVSNTLAEDIEGDGEVGFIFASGARLHALSADTGTERWIFDLPDAGTQLLACGTGEGRCLLVATASGDVLRLSFEDAPSRACQPPVWSARDDAGKRNAVR